MEKNPHAGKVDVVALSGEMEMDVVALKGCGVIDKYLDFSPPAAGKSAHLMTCLMALKRGGIAVFDWWDLGYGGGGIWGSHVQ